MRIVIEIEGNKVTVLSADGVVRELPADVVPEFTEGLPGEPPAALLERAKKLGAMNAGAAPRFGTGAELAAVAPTSDSPKLKSASRKRGAAKKSRPR
jgi:hypothetical protein